MSTKKKKKKSARSPITRRASVKVGALAGRAGECRLNLDGQTLRPGFTWFRPDALLDAAPDAKPERFRPVRTNWLVFEGQWQTARDTPQQQAAAA